MLYLMRSLVPSLPAGRAVPDARVGCAQDGVPVLPLQAEPARARDGGGRYASWRCYAAAGQQVWAQACVVWPLFMDREYMGETSFARCKQKMGIEAGCGE